MESSSLSLGEKILAELDRRDRAYYYWSILAFILSFLPMLIAYPPWAGWIGPSYYYPADYGSSAVHISALSSLNGADPYIEMVYCVATRIAVGLVAKGYFALVRFRDNLLSTTENSRSDENSNDETVTALRLRFCSLDKHGSDPSTRRTDP